MAGVMIRNAQGNVIGANSCFDLKVGLQVEYHALRKIAHPIWYIPLSEHLPQHCPHFCFLLFF